MILTNTIIDATGSEKVWADKRTDDLSNATDQGNQRRSEAKPANQSIMKPRKSAAYISKKACEAKFSEHDTSLE
jgi:hypothetical protein